MRASCFVIASLLTFGINAASAAGHVIPAQDFSRHFQYLDAELSPTGEYVSVLTPFEERRELSIIKLSGKYDRSIIKFQNGKETVASATWSDDKRLLVWKAIDVGSLRSPLLNGDVFAVDADAGNQSQIFGYVPDTSNFRAKVKDEGITYYMATIPGTQGESLFYYKPWLAGNSANITSIFRVDTHTGRRQQIESVKADVSVAADNAGVPRLIWTINLEGDPVLLYRPTAASDWQPLPKSLAGRNLWISRFEKDNNHAYAWISDKGEPRALYRIDLAAGTRERIAGDANMDPGTVLYAGYEGSPLAIIYDAGRPKVEYIDSKSEWAQLHAGLMKLFAGQLVTFVNFTKDNNKILFYVYSDRHPGAYYIFDRTTKTPLLLFEVAEWIDPNQMAPTRPIEFKNASGQTLYGLYTAPAGKTGPLPTVVMPHGGPFGIHDAWGFDADTQFLASRGYAVLQINYRGSSGRGESFERSTYRQWGTGIQEDIADGVRWAIAQNLVDAKRICIYGASFGGYSALMNPINNPGLYRCAIGYAGVYDLAKMSHADARDSRQMKAESARSVGTDPEMLATQSPALQAARLDVPVLLIHGKSDHTAPIEQFNAMEAALKKAGKPFESLVKSNEGHGFYDPKNQTEAYQRMEAFLARYNPAN